jgi:hypothetical protein
MAQSPLAASGVQRNEAPPSVYLSNRGILPHFGKFRKILSPIRCFCETTDHAGRLLDEKWGRPMLSRPDTSVGPIIADFGMVAH